MFQASNLVPGRSKFRVHWIIHPKYADVLRLSCLVARLKSVRFASAPPVFTAHRIVWSVWTDVAFVRPRGLCSVPVLPVPRVPGRSHRLASVPLQYIGRSVHRCRRSPLLPSNVNQLPLAIVGPRGFNFPSVFLTSVG